MSRGLFIHNGNSSHDKATQLQQFAKDLKNIDFSSDGSRRLWLDWYWSTKEREYSCRNMFEGDLLDGDYLKTLPVITNPLNDGAGIIGSCSGEAVITRSVKRILGFGRFPWDPHSHWQIFIHLPVQSCVPLPFVCACSP
jgi:hypothetical protein